MKQSITRYKNLFSTEYSADAVNRIYSHSVLSITSLPLYSETTPLVGHKCFCSSPPCTVANLQDCCSNRRGVKKPEGRVSVPVQGGEPFSPRVTSARKFILPQAQWTTTSRKEYSFTQLTIPSSIPDLSALLDFSVSNYSAAWSRKMETTVSLRSKGLLYSIFPTKLFGGPVRSIGRA